MRKLSFFIIINIALASCVSTDPFYNSEIQNFSKSESSLDNLKSVLYLIGDTGAADTTGNDKNLNALAKRLIMTPPEKTGIVFLGDNIYHDGMHSKYHKERKYDEATIIAQLETVYDFEGQIAFIPGNHDWNRGHADGLKYLERQEKFIEHYLEKEVFYPSKGCPGPELIEFGDDIALIILDSQWWLQNDGKPIGASGNCDIRNDHELILSIRDMLKENKHKQIVVAAHHPMFSNGEHGGYFTFLDHIFPLRKIIKNGYIPLPLLGSIYPLYRKLVGNIQDIPHERYTAFVNLLKAEFRGYPGIIYASGHEHNLQFTQKNGINHIISGGGSKTTHFRRNNNINFGINQKGFARILEFNNGEIWIEVITPSKTSKHGEVIFSQKIGNIPAPRPPVLLDENYIYDDKLQARVANADYAAGKAKEVVLGKLYRDVWTDSVYVPVLDMDKVAGGLIALQKGGGMQSKSIRYEGANGVQYVSRSINKFPERLLPAPLRTTLIADVLKDGIASSHPYAFVTVPPMADAVKVYHTNPQIMVLPDNPRLGEFREEFAGMLVLFEERPAHNQEFNPSFGNAKKVVSSFKVIDKLRETHDAKVDETSMLRARLFDMFLADWDRHDDQWRWARFKEDGKTIYKPIPRDRDQVYFKQDGIIPTIVSQPWAQRRFQSFIPEVKDMAGQNMNAQWIDRDYLTNLKLEDWLSIADSMQIELTDEIIEEGVKRLPKSAFKHTGAYTIKTLKARRDQLKKFAEEYYYILAKQVNVTGSEEKEYFEIEYFNEGVNVKVYSRKHGKKNKEELHFDRKFKNTETKEIAIYGIGGHDEYEVIGNAEGCKILVRIIGGSEKDKYHLNYEGKGLKKKLHIYEFDYNDIEKSEIANSRRLAYHEVEDEAKHPTFGRNEFKYDSYLPLLAPGFSPDDGLFFGAGVSWTKQGFKHFPYKTRHRVVANAASTGAAYADYFVDARQVIGNLDFSAELEAQLPNWRFSFYGLGNEPASLNEDWRAFQMRVDQISLRTFIKKSSKYQRLKLQYGPQINWFKPQANAIQSDRFPESINSNTLTERIFIGGELRFEYKNVDHPFFPIRGIWLKNQLTHAHAVTENIQGLDNTIATHRHEFRLYFPLTFIPFKHTFAFKAAFAQNLNNNVPFYYLNYIGGINEMRGFRRNRLSGKTSLYSNIDWRYKLAQSQNHILPMEMGMILFTDIGRVWTVNDSSNKWHLNYGGGIYFNPLGMFVINATYGYSQLDGGLLTVKGGFQF